MSGFNVVLSDKIVKRSSIASMILLLLTLLYIIFIYKHLPPFLPLFNQLPWGEERLGSTITIFFPLIGAIGIGVGNLIFSRIFYRKMPLVVRMLGITTLFTSFITFIFIIRITLLIL